MSSNFKKNASTDCSQNDIDRFIFNNFMTSMVDINNESMLFTAAKPFILCYDSEFTYKDGVRYAVSYQFSCSLDNMYYSFVFISNDKCGYFKKRLSFRLLLNNIFYYLKDNLNIPLNLNSYHQYLKYVEYYKDFRNRKGYKRGTEEKPPFDLSYVVLLTHFGRADLSIFNTDSNNINLIKYCSEIQKGIVTIDKPASFMFKINNDVIGITLTLRDTMAHTVGEKSLKALGKICGMEKKEIEDKRIYENMDKYLLDNTNEFIDYAIHDTLVPLAYLKSLYNIENNKIPVTLTSASAKYYKNMYKSFLHVKNDEDFLLYYAGLKMDEMGVVESEGINNKNRYYVSRSLEPRTSNLKHTYHAHIDSYHGGLNSCYTHGFITDKTYDLDLSSAYITALSVIPKLEFFSDCVIKSDYYLGYNDLDSFITKDYIKPFTAYVDFEFPEGSEPCIPQTSKNGLIYTRTGSDVACNVAELYLALKQNCKIHVRTSYEVNVDTTKMYNKEIFKSFTTARGSAERLFGKKSAQALLVKTATNGVYGKTAQGLAAKKVYIALDDTMEDLEPCTITQPVFADTATSIVRAVLLATKIQLENSGFKVHSITTDGMITNATLDTVRSLDLFGFKEVLEKTLKYIKNEDSIWECKHEQESFLNICTRGNIATNESGVFAKNSFKMPEEYNNNSVASRKYLIDYIMSSNNSNQVKYIDKNFSTFKEIAQNKKDFEIVEREVANSMSFDYKRKPYNLMSKDVTVNYDNETVVYKDTLYFDTTYYEDIKEFECYKNFATQFKRKSTDVDKGCIRTLEDAKYVNMKAFNSYNNIKFKSSGDYNKDIARNIIRALVNNKHDNVYEELKSVDKSCRKTIIDIINRVCCIEKAFTVENYKQAIRNKDTVDFEFYKEQYNNVVEEIKEIIKQHKQ